MSTNSPERSAVAHLLRRTGFGGLPGEVDEATARGYDATVDDMLRSSADAGADAFPRPTLVNTSVDAELETIEERKARQVTRRAQRLAIGTWWLERMTVAQRPIAEKMTLFWSGHFATEHAKVNDYRMMLLQLETFRHNATGNWGTL